MVISPTYVLMPVEGINQDGLPPQKMMVSGAKMQISLETCRIS
jgi:hypothetical protein